MKRMQKDNKGFTLIELIIVVAIIAMLIAMIAPNLSSFLGTASDTTLNANAKTAYTTGNAWATQMKVAGHSTTNGDTVVLTSNGSAFTVTINGAADADSFYNSVADHFSAAEIGEGTITLVFSGINSVETATWATGTGASAESATYPSN